MGALVIPYIYRSNLSGSGFPNLRPCFPRAERFTVNYDHEILRDPEFPPVPGWISDDEAAILWEVARRIGGDWIEIGSQTGWSGAHIAIAKGVNRLLAIEPRLRERAFFERWHGNMDRVRRWATRYRYPFGGDPWPIIQPYAGLSCEYSVCDDHDLFDGGFIDGDHGSPVPQNDAQLVLARLKSRGVIVFHDFGGPVMGAVKNLLAEGLHCRVYDTPQMMAVCWRGEFEPPDHEPDPRHVETFMWRRSSMDFDFTRCA